MDEKEIGVTHKKESSFVCPSFTTFIIYTSIVVVLSAVLIPFELHFGLINFYKKFDLSVSEDLPIHKYILHKLRHVYPGYVEKQENLFTKEELKKYSGESEKIYLAILGNVFDVTKGKRHYGKGGAYSFFAGIDASRAYVTGIFKKEGLVDNIDSLQPQEYLGLLKWLQLFQNDYVYVGKVIGYFYDSNGNALEGVKIFDQGVIEGTKDKAKEDEEKVLFPECISKWTPETGADVWCSQLSGGISRDWVGYPRMFFVPGQTNHRCACIKKENFSDPRFREYENCEPTARSCKLPS